MKDYNTTQKKTYFDCFVIGVIGIQLLMLGFVVLSTRFLAGVEPPIYQIPPKYKRSGSIVVNLDCAVYLMEVVPSIAGLLVTTFAFSKAILKTLKITFHFPRPKIVVLDTSNFKFYLSMLLSSWSLFYWWLKAFLL